MCGKRNEPARGRPQTLDREKVLQTALMRYWQDGPRNVSINDISAETGTSKPGIYREFGSDDGLKEAVLRRYATVVLEPLFEVLGTDQSFTDGIDSLIKFTVQDRDALGLPNGCLHAAMRLQRDDFGPLTQRLIGDLRLEILKRYEVWIDQARSKGQFGADMSTETAALYFDAHNGSIMRMQKEGINKEVLEEILRNALSIFAVKD